MSFARNFAAGQQIAQTAMDAFDQARLGKILSETKDAKVQDLAPVEDLEAVPVEQINSQPQVASAEQPFVTPDSIADAAAPMEPKRTQVSPKQFQLLGKTYDAPLTDEQTKAARADSLKTRMSELFNPVRGLKQMRELELQDQEDFKFGLFKTEAEQKAKDRKQLDDIQEAGRKAMADSYFGKAMTADAQDLSSWYKENEERQAKIAAGTPETELPELREKPVRRTISPAQMLASSLSIMNAQVAAGGKFDPKEFASHVQTLQKLEEEGVGRALDAAAAGASVDEVAKLFNKSGQARFDPTNVISDVKTKDENGVPNRVITYFDPVQKRNIEINVNAERAAIGQAGKQVTQLLEIAKLNTEQNKSRYYGSLAKANNALERQREAAADKTNAQIDGTLPGDAGKGKGKGSADRSGMTQAEIAKADMLAYYEKATANDPNRTIGGAAKISDAIDQLAALNPAATSSELLNMATQMQTPEFVAEAAKSATVSLDPKTGSIVRTIPTAAGGSKKMAVGQLSFDQLDDAGREQLSSDVRKQAGELGINLPQLHAAARDPGQYKQLMAMVREQAKFRMLEAARSSAAQSGQEVPMAQIEQRLNQGMQRTEALFSLARKLYANQ